MDVDPRAAAPGGTSASFYDLLGLPPGATGPELRRAFRSRSKLVHPDTTVLPTDEAQEAFRQLQQAYLTLSDPERRQAYDASLEAARVKAQLRLRSTPVQTLRTATTIPVRRALSGGEWFALTLLALAVVFSLVLGVGLAWARGAAFVTAPSWWPVPVQAAVQTAQTTGAAPADGSPAPTPGSPL